MQERIAIRNESMHRLDFEVSLELAADFADIISVKLHDFALGDPLNAPDLPPAAPATYDEARRQILIVGPGRRPEDPDRPFPGRPDRLRGSRLRPLPRTARTLGSHRRRRPLARPGDGRRARGAPHRRAGDARGRRCRVDAAGAARSWRLGEPAARLRPLDRGSRPRCACARVSSGDPSSPRACRGS